MRRVRKPINQINVVPYIDVMLVLLVIFMVTAPLVTPGQIELPSVGTKPIVPVAPLEVTLNTDKTILLLDREAKTPATRVTQPQLLERIQKKQQQWDQPVVIAADKNARYDDVVQLLDFLQKNGIRKVGLLVRPAS